MTRPRYVFLGGLHRSGTTLVADCLAAHPEVRALPQDVAPEGEGVFLQGAIPHDALAGVPGEWAFDPAMHLTEGGPWDRLEVRDRLRADWEDWYPPGGTWRLEKSPVNLLRMRLLQRLFPACQFVIVTRHPVASARAVAKWSDRPEPELISHWEHAHALMAGDLPRLHNWLVVRFEDLTERPDRELARLFAFLRLDPVPSPRAIEAGLNDAYLARAPVPPPGPMAERLGYGAAPNALRGAHWFRDVREAIA